MEGEKLRGRIKKYDSYRAFGFIAATNNIEYFFHVTGTINEVRVGDPVEFDLAQHNGRVCAINVRLIEQKA